MKNTDKSKNISSTVAIAVGISAAITLATESGNTHANISKSELQIQNEILQMEKEMEKIEFNSKNPEYAATAIKELMENKKDDYDLLQVACCW